LAAVVASALEDVIDRNALFATGCPHPLVDALYAEAQALIRCSQSQCENGAH
jgi:hypothetical protein